MRRKIKENNGFERRVKIECKKYRDRNKKNVMICRFSFCFIFLFLFVVFAFVIISFIYVFYFTLQFHYYVWSCLSFAFNRLHFSSFRSEFLSFLIFFFSFSPESIVFFFVCVFPDNIRPSFIYTKLNKIKCKNIFHLSKF